MTPTEFCYWLQGYFELADSEEEVPAERELTSHQVKSIQNHLALVFEHSIDPSYTEDLPRTQAEIKKALLQHIHDGVEEKTLVPYRPHREGPTVYKC